MSHAIKAAIVNIVQYNIILPRGTSRARKKMRERDDLLLENKVEKKER